MITITTISIVDVYKLAIVTINSASAFVFLSCKSFTVSAFEYFVSVCKIAIAIVTID